MRTCADVESLVIYYFSGTGNAKRLAETAAAWWRKSGCDVTLHSMEQPLSHTRLRAAQGIGIITPVYAFGLPELVIRFLKRLPVGAGRRAFALTAIGNAEFIHLGRRAILLPPSEGNALLQIQGLLYARDYQLVSAHPVEMPTNWTLMVHPPSDAQQTALFERARARVAVCIKEMDDGVGIVMRPPWLWRPVFALTHWLFLHAGRRLAGKCFTATARCNGCRACEQQCPTGALRWQQNRPYWGWGCQQCFRCVNYCPRGAIDVPILSLVAFAAALAFLEAPLIHLPTRWQAWLGGYTALVDLGIYLAMLPLVLWLMHRLHFHAFTRRLLPRWYAMTHRERYREPHFVPEPRVKQPTSRAIPRTVLDGSLAAELRPRTIWVKAAPEAGTEVVRVGSTKPQVEKLPPAQPKKHHRHTGTPLAGDATTKKSRTHAIMLKPTGAEPRPELPPPPKVKKPARPVETPRLAPPPRKIITPKEQAPPRAHTMLVKPEPGAPPPPPPAPVKKLPRPVPPPPPPPERPHSVATPPSPPPAAKPRAHTILVKPVPGAPSPPPPDRVVAAKQAFPPPASPPPPVVTPEPEAKKPRAHRLLVKPPDEEQR